MEKKQILEWAIAGARSQLTALENELAAISKGLTTGTRVLVKGKPVKRRKLYTMSAAARKAASESLLGKATFQAEAPSKSLNSTQSALALPEPDVDYDVSQQGASQFSQQAACRD